MTYFLTSSFSCSWVTCSSCCAGNDDSIHADGLFVLVLDGDLRLSVRAQVRQQPRTAHLREAHGKLLRQNGGERHQFGRFRNGIAEHHALVARTDLIGDVSARLSLHRGVHAQRDVRTLAVNGGDNGEGIVGKSLAVHVSDVLDRVAHDLGNVHIAVGGKLAHHEHHSRGGAAFDRHAGIFVLGEDGVQHRVRDLIAHLIGMTFRHAFAGKKVSHCLLLSIEWAACSALSVSSIII